METDQFSVLGSAVHASRSVLCPRKHQSVIPYILTTHAFTAGRPESVKATTRLPGGFSEDIYIYHVCIFRVDGPLCRISHEAVHVKGSAPYLHTSENKAPDPPTWAFQRSQNGKTCPQLRLIDLSGIYV